MGSAEINTLKNPTRSEPLNNQTEKIGQPINQLLNNLLVVNARLEIDPEQYLYLAAIHMWDRDSDDTMNLVQKSFDEETVCGIVRYVDKYTGREEGNTDSRASKLLKWGVEQRLMTLAGTSVHQESSVYRLTQLTHDLLKPYFKNDDFDQQESLSQRYKRMEVLFQELNAIEIEEPEEWFESIRSYLPTLKDLLEGVSKNQDLLIEQFGEKRKDITKKISSSILNDMTVLLSFADELMKQINDLKSLILTGSDQVLMQLALLRQTAVSHSAPSRLQNGLDEIDIFLAQNRDFAEVALLDLTRFLQHLMQNIRFRLTLDPNANLSQLIDNAIDLIGKNLWGLALPFQERNLLMREWLAPPPPIDNTLPILKEEGTQVVRQNPTHILQEFANQIVELELNKNHQVELPNLLRRVIKPQEGGFNEIDRHRLAILVLKSITSKASVLGNQAQPGWVPIDDENKLYLENIWVQGRLQSKDQNDE